MQVETALPLLCLAIPAVFCATREHRFEMFSIESASSGAEMVSKWTSEAAAKTATSSVTKPSVLTCAHFCVTTETCVAFSYQTSKLGCLPLTESSLSQVQTSSLNFKKLVEGSCNEVREAGYSKSGAFSMVLPPFSYKAYCDFSTAGGPWTVFLRRRDGSEGFSRGWSEYQAGFGDPLKDFWLGNDLLHRLTASGLTQLRVDLTDFEGRTVFAQYSSFQVANSSLLYRLNVSGYSGTAGDGLLWQDGQSFSTIDQDHDLEEGESCANSMRGAWWFGNCSCTHLNGHFYTKIAPQQHGVLWCDGQQTFLFRLAEMKITRPK